MATSCEGNNWFWDYVTLVNNTAKCDICCSFFQITRVQKTSIMLHITSIHSVDYQRIVSTEGSQKDLESQLYIIQNNDIICKFCNSTFYAKNSFYHIRNHLETTHEIKEDKAAEICDWLRKYYFDESDTDVKRRCISCNEAILNKPLLLMSHLSKAHKVNVPLENISVGFLISKNWVWEYFTRDEKYAKCSICSENFPLRCDTTNIIRHIKMKHDNIFDVSKNSKKNINWPYSITEINQIKCDICDKIYTLLFSATLAMKKHLIKTHNLNEDIARKLCNLILEYLPTSNCNICENMFQTNNSFKLMIHLKEAHQVRVTPEIIPKRLPSELSSLYNSDGYAKDIVTSSKSQQPNRSFDQSPDCNNFYDQIDESSVIRTTRLSSEISSLFNSNRYAQDIVTTSKSQQPTCSFDQSIDCDNYYDQINESSEMRTTRLSSELSSLFYSDGYAQYNATLSSYHQTIKNIDQSSECDNLYDQIDDPSKIRTTKYGDKF